MERDRFLKYSYYVANNVPAMSDFGKVIKEKHNKGVKIPNNDIIKHDSHWLVRSQSVRENAYEVKKVADICHLQDHCSFKCSDINCGELCTHLYECTCGDGSNLCKHIHKVHLLNSEYKLYVTDDFFETEKGGNVSGIDPQSLNLMPYELNSNASSVSECIDSKEAECKKLCSELLELIKIPQVKEAMLTNVVSCLKTLVAGMRGIANLKNNPVSVMPQSYIAPNQKIPQQIKFYNTSKKKKTSLHEINTKKQRLNEENVDDPIEQKPPLKTYLAEKNSECVRPSIFSKFNQLNVNNPTSTLVTVNNINLSFYALKSLDPFISQEEENYLKSISPCFQKGWIYDSVIDAFFWLLANKFKNCKAVESIDSVVIFSEMNILKFPWVQEVSSIELLIIPIILDCHWKLVIVNMKSKIFEYFDPFGGKPDENTATLIRQWCGILNKLLHSESHWQIVFPNHVKQTDSSNCGVFISFFVYQKLNNFSLTEDLDVVEFRAFMLEQIIADLNL
ncbi:hypothetical protein AVEN_83296-1 [Araneus ventricosus]|uniref:Ubiquitin-like protease family profile domain-containing protein n=1 Tax=Araneus ventricosus TaxID=182803 RepID=A0A4Y2XAC7_ARAVE|nr:hypothetical protein AVEN_83296-1 [Araneus ventricosus]